MSSGVSMYAMTRNVPPHMPQCSMSIRRTVDRISLDDHELAKKAKDLGSAAVFVSLVNCAVVWGLVLYDMFGWPQVRPPHM